MGKKDIEEKLFEDYNDVFADIFNDMPISERGKITMCKVLDDAEKRGEKRGMVLGEKRGKSSNMSTIDRKSPAFLQGSRI